jgi:hypothetical protein
MHVLLEKHNINHDCIYFGDILQNSIIENGVFTRLIYSNSDIIINGIHLYVEIPMNHVYRENNRLKIKKENDMLNFMFYIENVILQKISVNKIKTYKLKDYLKNGFIKYSDDKDIDFNSELSNKETINSNSNDNCNNSFKFILKISGVWENMNEYGLTFKIIYI